MGIVQRPLPAPDDDIAIERFANDLPGFAVEIDARGVFSLSPTHSDSGAREFAAGLQLQRYADKVGGRVFGSSAGFRLADGSLRSPDAAWISDEHRARLTTTEKRGYWRTCPDIVIEILSDTDRWDDLIEKVELYARNGAAYAVAIDPFENVVETRGEPPNGLELDIRAIIEA
jgi:Uma2 family endonuclease